MARNTRAYFKKLRDKAKEDIALLMEDAEEICRANGIKFSVPADILDIIVTEVLDANLYDEALDNENILGISSLKNNAIKYNTLIKTHPSFENYYTEGLINQTIAHEICHWRYGHLKEIKQERDAFDGTLPLNLFEPEPEPEPEDIVCHRNWDKLDFLTGREREREREADIYGVMFLTSMDVLKAQPYYCELEAWHQRSRSISPQMLWRQINLLAHSVKATPTLLSNRLRYLGIIKGKGYDISLSPPQSALSLEHS